MSVADEFRKHFKRVCESSLLEEKTDFGRFFFIHPSSLPYCGLRRFLDVALNGIQTIRTVDVGFTYFVNAGSTMHWVLQQSIGMAGRIIGNWRCPKCKFKRELTTYKPCPHCGTQMRHEEISIKRGLWRGSLDTIYISKGYGNWVVDYKSCGMWMINSPDTTPSIAYRSQQNHYVPLAEQALGMKLDGWILSYHARENPLKHHLPIFKRLNEEKKSRIWRKIKRTERLHMIMLKAETKEEAKHLYEHKLCRDLHHHDTIYKFEPCPYAAKCFTSEMPKLLKETVNSSEHLPIIKLAPNRIRKQLKFHD